MPSYERKRENMAEVGIVGCPHCGSLVDARAQVYGAVADFAGFLLLSIEVTKKGQEAPWATLELAVDDARERRLWYVEDVFPYDLLAPFWKDGLAPRKREDSLPREVAPGEPGQTGGSPPSDPVP